MLTQYCFKQQLGKTIPETRVVTDLTIAVAQIGIVTKNPPEERIKFEKLNMFCLSRFGIKKLQTNIVFFKKLKKGVTYIKTYTTQVGTVRLPKHLSALLNMIRIFVKNTKMA